MMSYRTIKQNSRLVHFEGTKELVLRNTVPRIEAVRRATDVSVQSTLFEF
jgi:hypothetical protein